jgi:hypothetical protein
VPRRATLGIAVLSLIDFSPAAHAAEGEGWDWMVAPYLWAASIRTDVNAEAPPAGTDSAFSDVIDKIDGAFMARLEDRAITSHNRRQSKVNCCLPVLTIASHAATHGHGHFSHSDGTAMCSGHVRTIYSAPIWLLFVSSMVSALSVAVAQSVPTIQPTGVLAPEPSEPPPGAQLFGRGDRYECVPECDIRPA